MMNIRNIDKNKPISNLARMGKNVLHIAFACLDI